MSNNLAIYSISENDNQILLSKENFKRITEPVNKLKNKYDILFSDDINIDYNNVYKFLTSVYSEKYINKIKTLDFTEILCKHCCFSNNINNIKCEMCYNDIDTKQLAKFIDNDNDTIFTKNTFNQIINVAKILIHIINNTKKYTYAFIRPPGHHSNLDTHEGFCIINNIVLLAKNIGKKTLIFDWDLHHGNGTEKLVKDSDNIYFVSIHGYEKGFYPNSGSESHRNILNMCLSRGTTDDQYIKAFNETFVPFYNTKLKDIEVILISNGLDGHRDDSYKFFQISEKSYIHMTTFFKNTNKRLIFLLEGGYNTDVIYNVSDEILQTLI